LSVGWVMCVGGERLGSEGEGLSLAIEDDATLVEQGGQVLRVGCRGPAVRDGVKFSKGRDVTVAACDTDRPCRLAAGVSLAGGEYPRTEVAEDLRPEKAHALRLKPMEAGSTVRPLNRVHPNEGVGDDVIEPAAVAVERGEAVEGDDRRVALTDGSEKPGEGGLGGLGHGCGWVRC